MTDAAFESFDDDVIAVIGLGYVGLPLAVTLASKHKVIGFDIDQERIAELCAGKDRTLEVDDAELSNLGNLRFSSDTDDLKQATIYIVTVPTPIDEHNRPDLRPLLAASRTVGAALQTGALVIYESTVYPGATEEDCVPVLEQASGLTFNSDFFCGYSPERINPGDREHRLPMIAKVTSGSTPATADRVDSLYATVITAGTHKASSIKVAEAAKVIENTQRDLNIALMNELSMIFRRLDIDTHDVLAAAGTKWNFLPFRPGLVGGHCIGVDPYYLTHKAQEVGYDPQVILAGRRINDGMSVWVAQNTVKAMLSRNMSMQDARVLILGLTFKENCPDLRNTKVVDIVRELSSFGLSVDVHDPQADPDEARREYGLDLVTTPDHDSYSAIILAVGHDEYSKMGAAQIRKFGCENHFFYDLKHVFSASDSDARL